MAYGTFQPFDYQLLASLGPNIINAQLSAQKMLDMEEERKLREQKRLEYEKEQAFKKGLAEYYTAESAKPSLLGPPPVGLGASQAGLVPQGTWAQPPLGPEGVPISTGGDIDSGMFDTLGQRRTPAQEPAGEFETIRYNQAKAAEKKSPNRLAADFALKSGQIDYYLHFEKAAQVEEDIKRKGASDAIRDVIPIWEKFGASGLKSAWPMLEAAHPDMLKNVDPSSINFNIDQGVVEVKLDNGATVIFNKNNPRDMHIVPKQPTEEERKAALEKVKAETKTAGAHSEYYSAAAEAARARAEAYKKGTIGGAGIKPGKVTPTESAAIDDYVASQYFDQYGKTIVDEKWSKANPLSLAPKYGGKGGMFKKFIDDVYEPVRTGKSTGSFSGVPDSRQGLYPSGQTIKNNFDWVNQRTQQLYSHKMPLPQAYAQATNDIYQIIESQVGKDMSKVDWRKTTIQLPALHAIGVPGVPTQSLVPGPANDDDDLELQEMDYDPVTRTLKPRLQR